MVALSTRSHVAPPTGDQCAEHHGDAHGVLLGVDVPAAVTDEGGPVEQLDEADGREEANGSPMTRHEAFVPVFMRQVRLHLGRLTRVKFLTYNDVRMMPRCC